MYCLRDLSHSNRRKGLKAFITIEAFDRLSAETKILYKQII